MSLPRAARHSSGAANHTPNAEFPLRGHEPSICVGTSELRAMSIIRQRQRLRPGLVRLLHRAGTITIILSSCCAKNKRNNNKRLSLQSCNDRHNPELLLRRKAHGYHDHRHLDLVLGSRSTPARLGLQALEREYSCCRNQYLRNDYMFRAHLFRFQYEAGRLFCFVYDLVESTGSARRSSEIDYSYSSVLCTRRAGPRLLSLLLHCCCW